MCTEQYFFNYKLLSPSFLPMNVHKDYTTKKHDIQKKEKEDREDCNGTKGYKYIVTLSMRPYT